MEDIQYDPLTINVFRQWNTIEHLLDNTFVSTPSSPESLVIKLSELLFHPRYTILVASAFRPILSILCAIWLDQAGNESEKLAAFALLLNVHEELFPYVPPIASSNRKLIIFSIFAAFIRQTHFTGGLLNDIQKLSPSELHFRLLSYYRILFACPQAPMIFSWPPKPLFDVLKMPGIALGIKCLAIHSYAIHTCMSEKRRDELLEEHLGPLGEADVIIESGLSLINTEETLDGWVLPLSETLRVRELREKLLVPEDYYQREDSEPFQRLDLTTITFVVFLLT